jgi:potassium large conductance calcium-activated channel subfamily M alpha protein 1
MMMMMMMMMMMGVAVDLEFVQVLLHPKGHLIQPDDIGLIIAWDLHTAYAISKYKAMQLPPQGDRCRWKKSNVDEEAVELKMFRTAGSSIRTAADNNRQLQGEVVVVHGQLNAPIFADSPDGHFKLESKLRSAICKLQYENTSNPTESLVDDSIESGTFASWDNNDDHISVGSSSSRSSAADRCYPKGVSLEEATEILLSWPPIPHHGQPHPAVLERRTDIILQNLKQRTIQVVELKVPHILVCIQGNWPLHIYYFLRELRKPGLLNPPIVILYPNEPDAKQWGKVGIFVDTFFLKGSAVYELDLMRGGVLQAGLLLQL